MKPVGNSQAIQKANVSEYSYKYSSSALFLLER